MIRFIHIPLLILLLCFPFQRASAESVNKKFTVVIDAGHGGKDIGATDNGVKEKDINLKVAKQLESLLKKKMKNTNVVMTRDNDSFLTLQQRADKANKAQGDIFVSIHTNSVDKKNKNRRNIAGSAVYTLGLHKDENNLDVAMRENSVIEYESDYQQKYSGFDPQKDESYIIFEMAQKKNLSQSIRLAEDIENELVNSGRQNRGVHQAGFWVLWATSMPSVLVELDFICNPTSAKYISSDKGAKELAEAIFKAIQKYEKAWTKSMKGANLAEAQTTVQQDVNNKLDDTYLTEDFSAVTRAKSRTQRSPKPADSQTSPRRRRSAYAKELSENKSYEYEDIKVTRAASSGVVASSELEIEMSDLAFNDIEKTKADSKKSKAEKKRLQKEEKERKKEEKAQKKRKADAHNAKLNKLVTVYKIQILASTDLLSPASSRFCGLSPISTFKENNLYKYYYGESTDKNELEAVLADVKKKIPDAFIVTSQKSVQKNK